MNLLLNILLYVIVGGSEWYLALRRTLACARGERSLLVAIVFVENLLGLWVLANFVRANDWLMGVSYASGGAIGALLVSFRKKDATDEGETAGDDADNRVVATGPQLVGHES
ncbi:MAG: hypothetical protein PHR35_03870 [Kiritimatiellae bacterium]|nr:hypothetical protein [Kiritimatiellia bacterium]